MQDIEKVGNSKDVWVECPSCSELFYIHRSFYEPGFNHLKLFCPFCHQQFAKEDAKTWG